MSKRERTHELEHEHEHTPALDALLDVETNCTDATLWAAQPLLVAECVAVGHPVLAARILCRFTDARGTALERWLPTLHGLGFRAGDRVLVAQPGNASEALAIGVVDGFARRPETWRAPGPRVVLERDAALSITDPDGRPVVEIRDGAEGPVVRLLGRDVDVEIDGKLRLSADAIELAARRGDVRLSASDDVVVVAETINLN